jgi:hypothetical protein
VGLPYTVDLDSQSGAGMSSGTIRFNATPPENATAIYITEADANGNPFGKTIGRLSAGGVVYINVNDDSSAYCTWKVTAAVDSGSYYTLTVSDVEGSLPPDGAEVRIVIAPVEVTGVRKYKALLTQTGTNAPTATVMQNGLGGTPVWSYDDIGVYSGTFAGAFDGVVKPYSALQVRVNGINSDTIVVETFNPDNSPANNQLVNTYIEIEVYPAP